MINNNMTLLFALLISVLRYNHCYHCYSSILDLFPSHRANSLNGVILAEQRDRCVLQCLPSNIITLSYNIIPLPNNIFTLSYNIITLLFYIITSLYNIMMLSYNIITLLYESITLVSLLSLSFIYPRSLPALPCKFPEPEPSTEPLNLATW